MRRLRAKRFRSLPQLVSGGAEFRCHQWTSRVHALDHFHRALTLCQRFLVHTLGQPSQWTQWDNPRPRLGTHCRSQIPTYRKVSRVARGPLLGHPADQTLSCLCVDSGTASQGHPPDNHCNQQQGTPGTRPFPGPRPHSSYGEMVQTALLFSHWPCLPGYLDRSHRNKHCWAECWKVPVSQKPDVVRWCETQIPTAQALCQGIQPCN